jgi:hypothetical protein
MPGDKVGVKVGVDDPFDRHPARLGVPQIIADIAARIDNDCATGGFVADQIGRVRQTLGVVLLKQHQNSLPFLQHVAATGWIVSLM